MELEVTNLDELKELIRKASDLSLKARNTMYTLDETIVEINRWQPEYTEKDKDKDKIELLDEYVKSLDERLFVERCCDDDILLKFSSKDDFGIGWNLGYIDVQTGKFIQVEKGLTPEDLFNELLKYKCAFKGKYDELFKEDDNAETI